MKLSIKSILFFLILASPYFIYANVPNYGTKSGNIYPEEPVDSIQLIKDIVHIKLHIDSVHVKCAFWLLNSGSSKTISVAFPNYQSDLFSTKPVNDFKCIVNGIPTENIATVKLEETNYLKKIECPECIDPGPVLHRPVVEKYWYKWKIFIEENDTAKIKIEFDGKWGGDYCDRVRIIISRQSNEHERENTEKET